MIRPDGSRNRRLPCSALAQGTCFDVSPAFSPDGRRLATGTLGSTPRDVIAIRNAAGRVRRRIVQRFGVTDLAWGPSGRGLFVNDEADRIVNLSLAGPRSVFRGRGAAIDVDVSRQGRVAWSSERQAGYRVTNRSRTRVKRFKNPPAFSNGLPTDASSPTVVSEMRFLSSTPTGRTAAA